MSQPPPDEPPPSEPEPPPTLDPVIVASDDDLCEAVDEFVRQDPTARQQLSDVADHQEMLRGAVDADVWRLVLYIDELTTARFADAIVLVARWAFNEGVRCGGQSPEAS